MEGRPFKSPYSGLRWIGPLPAALLNTRSVKGRTMLTSLKKFLMGERRDIHDPNLFHKVSLVAFLAWVGLGADGLSSSAYGPDEAFRALGEHTGLAFFLALATARSEERR